MRHVGHAKGLEAFHGQAATATARQGQCWRTGTRTHSQRTPDTAHGMRLMMSPKAQNVSVARVRPGVYFKLADNDAATDDIVQEAISQNRVVLTPATIACLNPP